MFVETFELCFHDKILDKMANLQTVVPLLQGMSAFTKKQDARDLQWLQAEDAKRAVLEDAWRNYLECFTAVHYIRMAASKCETQSGSKEMLEKLHHQPPSAYFKQLRKEREPIVARYIMRVKQQHLADTGPVVSDWAKSRQGQYSITAFKAALPILKEKTRKATTVHFAADATVIGLQGIIAGRVQPKTIYSIFPKRFFIIDEIFPDEDGQPGMVVPWQEFLQLMNRDIGCVIETNGGSAFAFILEKVGRVMVHRPHPDSTLQSYHLRNIGMSLEKQFGWQRESFGCA
jgi:hypothetical protein